MNRWTVDIVGKSLKINYSAAEHLVKFMVLCDPPIARHVGEEPPKSGIGHGKRVYELMHNARGVVEAILETASKTLA